jgi:ABC-type multidrug transport system ATPase subunit
LRVEGLHKAYPNLPVLVDLSLEVGPGEVVALRGPNGAGKSTLIGCVAGTVIPDSGTVHIAGHDLRQAPLDARRLLRYLPQEVEIPVGLTGQEVLEFHAEVFGDDAGLAKAAELSGLGDRLAYLASTYSVGMRRRLVFAALAPGKPRLLVLDEPFAGIDHDSRGRFLDWLGELRQDGCGLLLAAHEQDRRELEALDAREFELSTNSG